MATPKILMTSFFTFSILLSFPITPAGIPTDDLEAVLLLLRANGHMLFANAISTSDLLFDLLSLPSVTLLAPTDPGLFALDMTQAPPFYLSTLRLHALPRRLSWTNLLRLPDNSFLSTLLTSRDLLVSRGDFGTLLVGGVQVVMPGLYYSSYVAVHGLAGIVTLRSPVINNHLNGTVLFRPLNQTTAIPPLPAIPRLPTNSSSPNGSAFTPSANPANTIPPSAVLVPATSPVLVSAPVLAPAPVLADFGAFSPAEPPEGLSGKQIKHKSAKQKHRTNSSTFPRTLSNHMNGTNSSTVNHANISPSPTIPVSTPIDRTASVSPPTRGLAALNRYTPAESPEARDHSPSPAPLTTNSVRSQKICDISVGGDICTVG